jgi:hypothetical protein
MPTKTFSPQEALAVGNAIGVNWYRVDLEQFRLGLAVELEHGAHDPHTNVTNDDLPTTGKIALAHLKELPDYYTRLAAMEAGATASPVYAPPPATIPARGPWYLPDVSRSTFWWGIVSGAGMVGLAKWFLDRNR